MKKRDKYMGMDVHQATTVISVLDGEGKVVLETTVETQAAAIIRLLANISGPLHITFEETTQAAWALVNNVVSSGSLILRFEALLKDRVELMETFFNLAGDLRPSAVF
jgi:hypothetical protein